MSELKLTMDELDYLYVNYPDSWPNKSLRMAALNFINKYESGLGFDEWEFETINSIVNLVNSRIGR